MSYSRRLLVVCYKSNIYFANYFKILFCKIVKEKAMVWSMVCSMDAKIIVGMNISVPETDAF